MIYNRERDLPADIDADEVVAWEHDELHRCKCGCKQVYTSLDDGSYDHDGDFYAEDHEPENDNYDERAEHGTYWAQNGSVVG